MKIVPLLLLVLLPLQCIAMEEDTKNQPKLSQAELMLAALLAKEQLLRKEEKALNKKKKDFEDQQEAEKEKTRESIINAMKDSVGNNISHMASIEVIRNNPKYDTPQALAAAFKSEFKPGFKDGFLKPTLGQAITAFAGNVGLGFGDYTGKYLYDTTNILTTPAVQKLARKFYGPSLEECAAYLQAAPTNKNNMRMLKAEKMQLKQEIDKQLNTEGLSDGERLFLINMQKECDAVIAQVDEELEAYVQNDIKAAKYFTNLMGRTEVGSFGDTHANRKGQQQQQRANQHKPRKN